MSGKAAQAVFGSKSRALVLEEVAKTLESVSAYAIARISGLDPKNVYRECVRLTDLGIFQSIPVGKNQTCYQYSKTSQAEQLRQFVGSLVSEQKTKGESTVEKIAASLPMTDYYVSLPIALRTTLDVFYSPDYVMIFIDERNRAMIPELLRFSGATANIVRKRRQRQQKTGVIINLVSLWGREFKYDEATGVSLASNEQSIADGLNYYNEIRDREIVRTLLTRASSFDMRKVIEKLTEKGLTKLYALILLKKQTIGKLEKEEETALGLLQKRKVTRLGRGFRSDLENEAIPVLFPNDEAYNGNTMERANETVSQVLNVFA